jgi:hypothetical protein
VTGFATQSTLPGVIGDDTAVTIRRIWRRPEHIALNQIIAVTPYPTIVWRTPEGRIRRSPIGFLYRSKSLYANRRHTTDREPLRNWLFERVSTNNRRTSRAADHLPAAELAEHLTVAQAALAWAEKHPHAACEYRDLWAKHVRGMQTAAARRATPTS